LVPHYPILWKHLQATFEGEDSVCLYAAQWPSEEAWGTDSDGTPMDYFIGYGVKTRRGRYLAPVFDPDSDDYTGKE